MQISDYKNAEMFVNKNSILMFELKKSCTDLVEYNNAAMTLLNRLELIDYIDDEASVSDKVTDLLLESEIRCQCLKLICDKDGAAIFICFFLYNMKMEEIADTLCMSSRTCWRHLGAAVKQFDIILGLINVESN